MPTLHGVKVFGLSDCFHGVSEALVMSGMELPAAGLNSSRLGNVTLLKPVPTSISTAVDSSSSSSSSSASDRLENVYVYVSIFLSLLVFLLLLLVIALHRLKNIISSSSSYPECTSNGGNSFTNIEICSLSSQRSTVSSLSC
ncbi:serine-rich and transmembrane domain-containing protein 1-like [Anguilla anguilla]|uniref:serine-rich and transmembrane domain-containing protein 1-like n=1 Tax=Anguilla anguilla TaxID=7936 RepID=UPI0015B219EA|nr:serine-rich and transmembrane domain-containing protein 1-like [Anguilla anguilla]